MIQFINAADEAARKDLENGFDKLEEYIRKEIYQNMRADEPVLRKIKRELLTWRNQFTFDDRNISQPTGATSAIGDFPSYNYMSDITKRGEIFGMESTSHFGAWYNTLTASSDTRNVVPGAARAKLAVVCPAGVDRGVGVDLVIDPDTLLATW